MSYNKELKAAEREASIKAKNLKHALMMRAIYDPTNKNKQRDAARGYVNYHGWRTK